MQSLGSDLGKHHSPLKIVPMEKELQTSIVHHPRFGERERFADKASQTLSERVIPAFHMSGFTGFLSGSRVLVFWDHCLVRGPEIGETVSAAIREGKRFPQAMAGLFTSISHRVSHDLPRLAAQRDPDPGLVRLFPHKRPQLIQFQHVRIPIVGIGLDQRFAQSWQLSGFFFIQAITEFRETPKVRSRPRKLLRSSYARRISSLRPSE